MDSDSIIMLLVMILLTAMSGYFSATETAFSSFNRIRLKSMAAAGDKRAAAVLRLDDNYDKLITTILIGNNIVNIVLTTIATLFFMRVLSNLEEDVIATISTVIITVAVLIFGEVTPKTLAKDYADGYVLATHGTVRFFMNILFPVTFLFGLWRKLLCKVFKAREEAVTTEDDLITMVDEAEQDGGLDEDESELIRSAIEFSDLTAGEILTPRIDIISIEEDTDPREIMMMF
ncbi:MAG: CNNM domain-containing protein, partial [Clostridia bacterium]|nr:CNNM domain-containing protein [Clostridia bacterium]